MPHGNKGQICCWLQESHAILMLYGYQLPNATMLPSLYDKNSLNDDFIRKTTAFIYYSLLLTGYYSLLQKIQATNQELEAKQSARLCLKRGRKKKKKRSIVVYRFIPAKNKTLCNLGHKPLITNTKQLADGMGSLQTKQRLNHIPPAVWQSSAENRMSF